MNCPSCGKQQLSTANFCTHCGISKKSLGLGFGISILVSTFSLALTVGVFKELNLRFVLGFAIGAILNSALIAFPLFTAFKFLTKFGRSKDAVYGFNLFSVLMLIIFLFVQVGVTIVKYQMK